VYLAQNQLRPLNAQKAVSKNVKILKKENGFVFIFFCKLYNFLLDVLKTCEKKALEQILWW
jgi:hypothetical protein